VSLELRIEPDQAAHRLEIILFQAAMKKRDQEYKLDYVERDDPERVEYFLKEHPNLIPEVRDFDLGRRRECIWPEDAIDL